MVLFYNLYPHTTVSLLYLEVTLSRSKSQVHTQCILCVHCYPFDHILLILYLIKKDGLALFTIGAHRVDAASIVQVMSTIYLLSDLQSVES